MEYAGEHGLNISMREIIKVMSYEDAVGFFRPQASGLRQLAGAGGSDSGVPDVLRSRVLRRALLQDASVGQQGSPGSDGSISSGGGSTASGGNHAEAGSSSSGGAEWNLRAVDHAVALQPFLMNNWWHVLDGEGGWLGGWLTGWLGVAAGAGRRRALCFAASLFANAGGGWLAGWVGGTHLLPGC